MNAFAVHALPLFLSLLLKVTLLLVLVWFACGFLRRASAATRHLVWTCGLLAVLLLPGLTLSLPHWDIPWIRAAAPAPAALPPASPPTFVAAETPAPPDPTSDKNAPAPASLPSAVSSALSAPLAPSNHPRRPFSALLILTLLGCSFWLLGALLLLSRLVLGLRCVALLARRSVSLDDAATGVADAAQQQIGLRRPVRFLRAADERTVAVPITWGFLRPLVVLPAASRSWSDECLRAALLHELAHVQRADWPTQLLARVACAVYWWHPLVWLAARQARAESERSCDDLVLATGLNPTDYAQSLVDVVRSLPAAPPPGSTAIAMAQPMEVQGRVADILAPGRDRRRLSLQQSALILALLALLLLPLAMLHTGAQAATAQTALPSAPADAADDEATLPNGYTIKVVGIARGVKIGEEEYDYAGPFWTPGGTSIPNPLLKRQAPGRKFTVEEWYYKARRRVALDFMLTHQSLMPQQGVNMCYELIGGTSVFDDQEWSFPNNDFNKIPIGFAAPFETHYYKEGSSVAASRQIVLPITICGPDRVGTIRCGIAAGPWQTIKAFPVQKRHDNDDMVLPGEQLYSALADNSKEAVRAVAVNDAGRQQPLDVSPRLAPDQEQFLPGLYVSESLARVKTILIQTRPYQFAEFRNIQLQPRMDNQAELPSAIAAASTTLPASHADLKFVYLNDVAVSSAAAPGKPYLLKQMPQADGRQTYILTDTRTGKQYEEPGPGQGAKAARNRAVWDRVVEDAPVILTGADVEPLTRVIFRPVTTNLGTGQQTTRPVIEIHYSPAGAKKNAAFSASHHGDVIGIMLNGELLTAPTIEATINGSVGEIDLGGTPTQAQSVADQINASAQASPEPTVAASVPRPLTPLNSFVPNPRDAAFLNLWTFNDSTNTLDVDLNKLKVALDNGANVEARFQFGRTALMWAAMSGRTDLAQLLLTHGANVNAKDTSGSAPLMLAASSGKVALIGLFLQHGADVNAANRVGGTALIYAASRGDAACVRLLLHHEADVHAVFTIKGRETALSIAKKNKALAVVSLLEAAGEKT